MPATRVMVRAALEEALTEVFREHLKNFSLQIVTIDNPEAKKAVLQARYKRGLQAALLAFELAEQAVHEVMGYDEDQLRHPGT